MSDGKKVLVVGCGAIGMRHLQGVALAPSVGAIQVVDPRTEAHDNGRAGVEQTGAKTPVTYHTAIDPSLGGGDLCVLGTQAAGRLDLVRTVHETLGYTRFLTEKVVTQSMEEYDALLAYAEANRLTIRVNAKTRAYALHAAIKEAIGDRPFTLTVTGGDHGLGCNGVHAADLFLYYDGGARIDLVGARIDERLAPSKRGSELADFSGALHGASPKGSSLSIVYDGGHKGFDFLTVTTATARYVIDHFLGTVFRSGEENNAAWERLPFTEDIRISHMTTTFAEEMLADGPSALPTIADHYPAQKFVFEGLLPTYHRLTGAVGDFLPVT
ncbi:MAG: hypothetical protein HQK87_06490 [Nitrospinae bacterium]|nr:hypothetical protein [Nitrospinota bacterium]